MTEQKNNPATGTSGSETSYLKKLFGIFNDSPIGLANRIFTTSIILIMLFVLLALSRTFMIFV